LEPDENPKHLLLKMLKIEATYRTPLTDDEQRAIVWQAGSGKTYGAIMLTTDLVARGGVATAVGATAEELVEAMYLQYRIDQSVKGQTPAGAGETTLAATSKGGKTFGGKCFDCGLTGHRKADCPNKGKGEKSASAVSGKKERYQGNCGFCDKKGHREADCWKKFPEKMPKKKSEEAAVTVDELVVCLVDSFSSNWNNSVVLCQEVQSDVVKFMEARLREVLNNPNTFIYGRGRVGQTQEVESHGLPIIAKAGETTSIFSPVPGGTRRKLSLNFLLLTLLLPRMQNCHVEGWSQVPRMLSCHVAVPRVRILA
jgi:hypothetical protein